MLADLMMIVLMMMMLLIRRKPTLIKQLYQHIIDNYSSYSTVKEKYMLLSEHEVGS